MRNLRRLGIAETVAMRVSGHKTANVFRRYDIVSEDDLRDVAGRLEERYTQNLRSESVTGTDIHKASH